MAFILLHTALLPLPVTHRPMSPRAPTSKTITTFSVGHKLMSLDYFELL